MAWPGVAAAGEPPEGEAGSGVVAEIWPLVKPEAATAPGGFEKWHAEVPPAGCNLVALDKLEIPAREATTMVRVRGVLVVPQTRTYVLTLASADPAELWLLDDPTGEWWLAQRANSPTNGVGTVKLEAGVPKRFELWTAGTASATVKWHAWPVNTAKLVAPAISAEVVPGSSLRSVTPGEGAPNADGLPDDWKRRRGLDPASGEGPDGPWGDPDGDRLLNWQERLADTDPRQPDAEGCAGFARWEVWRGIPGKFVFDLTRSGTFPMVPDETRYLRRLEIPFGNGNGYGSRLRCLVVPPADGAYTFALIANDTAELWLSDSESWQGRKLVAKVNHEGGQLVWPDAAKAAGKPFLAEQVSGKIPLQAGRRYYLEVLHKQDDKADHCAVGWTVPGAKGPQIIAGKSLVAWAPDKADAGDDGLPDDWQKSAGLLADGVDPSQRHAYADPDHDGLPNWDEWKGGTGPLKPDGAPATEHGLTCEAWTDLAGDGIADLVRAGGYPAVPSHATLGDNMDFSNEGENYGCRLRGYLTAPADGPYLFYISGNNACILWLGESEDKLTKRPLVRTIRDTGWRRFRGTPLQRGGPVRLKGGERYYIEMLFKRGARQEDQAADHSSVAWLRPDRPGMAETVIGPEFFTPYRKGARDGDDDDLPDDWEEAHGLDPANPAGDDGAWGDPDGDGLENFREFQAGLDPRKEDVHGAPGLALWECWESTLGDLQAFKHSPSFPLRPTRREWFDALEGPQGMAEQYGSRLRAFLVPPASGDYIFAIAGDDQCELWLGASESKFDRQLVASVPRCTQLRQWTLYPSQISRPVRLEAGKRYFIEALHQQGPGRDHVSVGWKPPGAGDFEIIRGNALAAFSRDPNDINDDDLPDDWQKENGIGLDAPGGDSDLDGDGLTNREEYRLGTRADRADTDGDGINDADELRVYHTDPLVKDTPPPVLETTAPLAQWSGTPGSWMVGAGGTLVSMERRGAVSWELEVSSPGVYLIEVVAGARGAAAYLPPVPVTVLIDGLETVRGVIVAGEQPSRLAALTRWLATGTHRVTLDNRNVRAGVGISIVSVNLYRHEGADLDTDSIPDWLENICGRSDQVADNQSESAVSPACVEGEARFAEDVSLAVGGVEVSAHEGLRGRWFADVPLDAASSVELKAAFEGGSVTRSATIRWLATNLMTCPEVLRVRVGDALLLTAVPEDADPGAVNFEINGGADLACAGTADQPQQVIFAKAGRTVLSVTAGAPQGKSLTRTVTVEVCAGDFGEEFSLATGYPRAWELPSVPRELHLEADSWLALAEESTTPPAPRTLTATTTEVGPARVLARLHRDGPIVTATTVNGFHFATATETGNYSVIRVLADGTRVVEVRYVIDGVIPKDLSVWLHLYVTDAIFANGDTWYHLTVADFDENGEARILIHKAPGTDTPYVCHWVLPFDEKQPADSAPEAPAADQ